MGAAVPDAVVAIGTDTWPCSANGTGEAAVAASGDRVGCRVTAAGTLPWQGDLRVSSVTNVVLRRVGSLRVSVLDDDGLPVPRATVWVTVRPSDEDQLEADPGIPRGVTGEDGTVQIDGILHGRYLMHARHDVLLHSARRLSQMGILEQSLIVHVGREPANTVMRMTMPYVCGIQVVDEPMFYSSFQGSGDGYHSPSNADGACARFRLRHRLQAAHPGAEFMVTVRDVAPPQAGAGAGVYGDFVATAWALGREAHRVRIAPVPLASFRGPHRISAWELPASAEFGGLRITVKAAGGPPIAGMRFTIGTPHHLWRSDVPEVHHMFVRCGELVTLPVGTYDLSCEGFFESKTAGLNRNGLQVKRGEILEVVLDSPVSWSWCRIALRGAGSSDPLVGGAITLTHQSTGVKTGTLVNSFAVPLTMWIPSGTVALWAQAIASDPAFVWRVVDEAVEIRGGTVEAPQVISREMQLVPQ
jgi:hypothetical protein